MWVQQVRGAGRAGRLLIIAYLLIVVTMLFLETWLVYPAPSSRLGDWNPSGLGHEDVWFESADGTKLHGWFVPHESPKHAIVYFHGNGEHIAFNADLAERLRNSLDASVLLFDYRGYGQSEGRPSEAGCIADGIAAQMWLARRLQLRPQDIVLMGRSLGGGVAVAVAAEQGARALVLQNTFPTMYEVAALHYPWLPVTRLMRNRYDSVSRIRQYSGPLLQSHGVADSLIPINLARRLFDAAPTSEKTWLDFADCGHNDPCPADYYDELSDFLARVGSELATSETARR